MLVIPAVDVRAGRTVRLRQGDYGQETVFEGDPVDVARAFIAAGAQRLHVVDLDAARGRPDATSEAAVRRIVAAARPASASVEVAGGVRTAERAREWLDAGAELVVIGSVAVRDPDAARDICESLPGHVLMALDVRDGRARLQGWTQAGGDATGLLEQWSGWPVAGVIYTDTSRDGMLDGPDFDGLDRCRAVFDGPLFLSGGVRDVADVVQAAARGADGVVIGRALLEGHMDLRRAIETVTVAP